MVLLTELLLFAPAIVFALRRPSMGTRSAALALALWLGCVSAIAYSDRTREAITGFLLREETVYAPGFSDSAFDQVTAGQSASEPRAACLFRERHGAHRCSEMELAMTLEPRRGSGV
jgi:hypothetical protein